MSRSWMRVLALAFAMMLLGAACGGDDDVTKDDTDTAASGDNTEFCEAYTSGQAAVIAAQTGGGDAAEIPALLDSIEENAPDEISAEVDQLIPQVRQGVEEQDEKIFRSDEFQELDEKVDLYVADNCGYEHVEVSAVDYAFEGVPATLPAGPVSIHFSNDGDEVHEMILVNILDDEVTMEALLEMSDKEAQEKIEFKNGFFRPPGESDAETVSLEAGRYGVVCFIPVGATDMKALEKAEGPPHAVKGMMAEFTVE